MSISLGIEENEQDRRCLNPPPQQPPTGLKYLWAVKQVITNTDHTFCDESGRVFTDAGRHPGRFSAGRNM